LPRHEQADIAAAEGRAAEVQQQLAASEGRAASQAADLAGLQKQLEGLQQQLDKNAAAVTERDNKVCACVACARARVTAWVSVRCRGRS
jgi:chromosome segregation ATPase